MRPSSRAAEDEKRIKARSQKKEVTPGPGTYSPQRLGSTSANLAGTTAFKSKLDRTAVAPSTAVLNEVGDPGAYEDPKNFLSLAATAKSTARSVSKTGKDGFGGTEKRTLLLSNIATKPPTQGWTGPIEDTPGPAAYTAKVTETGKEHDMQVMDSGEKMKSAAFASTMKRPGVVLRNAFTPGAGTYSPNHDSVQPVLGNLISKTGRDHKFVADNLDGTGDDCTTQAHVGPGSYNSHLLKTIGHEQQVMAEVDILPHASFMSDTFRTIYTGQNE